MSTTERTADGAPDTPPAESAAPAELASVVRDLSDRIETLRADVRRLGGPGLPTAEPGWDDQGDSQATAPSYAWVSSIGAPVRQRPGIPRLLLEVLFLAGVAIAAALAELDAPVIAAVMAASWVLVALIEWAASRADRKPEPIAFSEPAGSVEPLPPDPSWFVPPVEQTLVERGSDSPTAVTRLPPAQDDLDATVERPPSS